MLDVQFGHGEVVGVAGSQYRPDRNRRGSDQAISLMKGDSPFSVFPAPLSRLSPLRQAKGSEAHRAQKSFGGRLFMG